MTGIEVDIASFPVVVVRHPRSLSRRETIRDFLTALDEVLSRNQPYAMITDLRRVEEPMDSGERQRMERWIDDNRDDLARLSIGNALVVTQSPLMRGTLNAFYHSKPPPNPHRVVHSMADALEWCLSQLTERAIIDAADCKAIESTIDLSDPSSDGEAAVPAPPSATTRSSADYAPVLDLFDQPAFLVDGDGAVVHANPSAHRQFKSAPPWLAYAVSSDVQPAVPLCRIVSVLAEGTAHFIVVPDKELIPPPELDARLAIELPPSLDAIADLLAQGMTDKEIAIASGLTVNTARTYVARIFKRTDVHGRAEFIALWTARARLTRE